MHKNELKLYLLILAVFIGADVFFLARYQNVVNEKEILIANKIEIEKFIEDFQSQNIQCLKTKKKIFAQKDIRQQIKRIAKQSLITEIQFKKNDQETVEIKFQVQSEKDAYNFLDKLYFELNEIVQFTSIKIGRFSDNKIHVVCIIKTELPQIQLKDIAMRVNTYNPPQINLFDIRKKHQLNCVILGQKIFVDDRWFSLGDMIDDYKITQIYQSAIELRKGKKSLTIQLGHSW